MIALGVKRGFGSPYIHYQNGKVEIANQKIQNKARKILESSGLPERFWPEVTKAAFYLHDRSPKANEIRTNGIGATICDSSTWSVRECTIEKLHR